MLLAAAAASSGPECQATPGHGLLAPSVPPARPHAPALPFTARARPVRSRLTSLAHTANLFFTQLSQWLPPALLILRPCGEGARR